MGKNTTEYQRQMEEYQERLRKKYDEMAGSSDEFDFLDDLPDADENENTQPADDMDISDEQEDENKIYDTDKVMLARKEDILEEALGADMEETDDYEGEEDRPSVMDSLKSSMSRVRAPKTDKRGTSSRNHKWYIALGIVLVLFVIVTICYLVSHARYLINKLDIHEISSTELMSNEGVKDATSDYMTIALFGVDSKDGNKNQGANSDTVMIVSINKKTSEMRIVSVYKDTYMYLENGLSDTNKLVYAYQTGGALASINSLNVNLDLYITDYITVDYSAMADLVDALGGVTVTVTEDEANSLNKNLAEQISISGRYSDGVYTAGTHTLNGQQTVAYTRIKNVGTGDVTRTKRQREVLTQIFTLIMDADNDIKESLISLAISCISASMTEDELLELMSDYSDITLTESTAYPFTFDKATLTDKGTVLVASTMAENVSALHDFLYDTDGYVPTDLVQNISVAISAETGVVESGLTGDTVGTDSFEADTTDDSGVQTLTDAPDGMYTDEE